MSKKKLDFNSLQKSLEKSVNAENEKEKSLKKKEYGAKYHSPYTGEPHTSASAPNIGAKPKTLSRQKQKAPASAPTTAPVPAPAPAEKKDLAQNEPDKKNKQTQENKNQPTPEKKKDQTPEKKNKQTSEKKNKQTPEKKNEQTPENKNKQTQEKKKQSPKVTRRSFASFSSDVDSEFEVGRPAGPRQSFGISGYFITQDVKPRKSEERRVQLQTTVPPSMDDKIPKRVRRATAVKFEDELVGPLPHRRLSYRDGSITMNVEDINEIVNQKYPGEGEDADDDKLSKGELMNDNDPILEKMDNSLDKIRLLNSAHEESLKEYQSNRTRFFQIFTMYIFLALLAGLTVGTFVYKYNHAFNKSPDEILSANETLRFHEYCRVYVNTHMLVMAGPTTHIFATSSLIYRLFSNVNRKLLRWIHGAANLIGSVCSFVGVYNAFECSRFKDKPHLRSLHMVIGFTGLLIQFLALGTGMAFIMPICKTRTRIRLSPYHANIGSTMLMAYVAAILTGTILMSKNYFKYKQFPQWYPHPYEALDVRTVCLNCVGLSTIAAIGTVFYLQANYLFRHRRQPAGWTKIQKEVSGNSDYGDRTHKMLRRMGTTLEKPQDAPMNSRKSFGHKRHFSSKSIPILINESENLKSNFTDMDFLIALE